MKIEIIKTKRLKDGKNFVIDCIVNGEKYGLIISAENVVKNFEIVQQLKEIFDTPDEE